MDDPINPERPLYKSEKKAVIRKRRAREIPIFLGILRRKISEMGVAGVAALLDVSTEEINRWDHREEALPSWAAEKLYIEDLEQQAESPEDGAPPLCADWEGKNVMICLPFYKSCSPFTAFSVMALYEREKMGIIMQCGDAFISHTRNKIARTFLATKAEWSLWVDDDMVLPMGKAEWFNGITGFSLPAEFAGLHTLNRLMSHQKPLVGGLYFGRAVNGRPMYAEGVNNPTEAQMARRGPQNVCKPTKWIATGCLLVHRSVFEAIDKKFPHLKGGYFSPSEHDLIDKMEKMQALLTDKTIPAEQRCLRAATLLEEGRILSNTNSRVGTGEDVIFSTRASAAGIQPHVDLGLVCGHVGSQIFGPHNTFPVGGFVHV